MDTSAVFARSIKGNGVHAAGSGELSGAQRTVLILMDGNRSAAEIHRVVAGICNGYSTITQLVDLGLVEKKPTAQIASVVRLVPQSIELRAQLRKYATKTLADTLGPKADKVCLQLDRAQSDDSFIDALEKARGILMEFAGAARANAFSAHIDYLRGDPLSQKAAA